MDKSLNKSPASQFFAVPSPDLGRVDDVMPENVTNRSNDWIQLSREILKKKKQAADSNQWQPTHEISEDHKVLHPNGAQYCPVLTEAMNFGYIVKWPAALLIRKVTNQGWQVKSSQHPSPFYSYHEMTSFIEAGQAKAFAINTGWTFVTPPGWSLYVKNLPNNLTSTHPSLRLAEGIIRTDTAVIGLQVHAYIPPEAPDEISISRGDPMLLVFPFQRHNMELVVDTSKEAVNKASEIIEQNRTTFANGPGLYKKHFVDQQPNNDLHDMLISKQKK